MKVIRATVAALVLSVAGLVGALAGPAAAQEAPDRPLPVPYQFLPSAVLAGVSPGEDPPGANDWSCRPTAAHPRPVVLVHGTVATAKLNWQTYAPLLHNEGYCVFALTYGRSPHPLPALAGLGGMTRMEESARELQAFVARVLRATGAAKVDLIGHSQGTLMPNHYVKFLGGARFVHNYVSLAPLWHGTSATGPRQLRVLGETFGLDPLALDPFAAVGCEACPQMRTGSSFITRMRAGGVAVPGVRYLNVLTKYDELVLPWSSGLEDGMRNVVVQDVCARDLSEHGQIAADPVAAAVVLNHLDPKRQRPVPCTLVLPGTGTPTL